MLETIKFTQQKLALVCGPLVIKYHNINRLIPIKKKMCLVDDLFVGQFVGTLRTIGLILWENRYQKDVTICPYEMKDLGRVIGLNFCQFLFMMRFLIFLIYQ